MIEIYGDIWSLWEAGKYIIIPTNGFIKNDGECVMGRGLAWQAKEKFPELPLELGKRIKEHGNEVFVFMKYHIITFPVKEDWRDKASLKLIEKSCKELEEIFRFNLVGMPLPVYLPKVGCGNGKLDWTDVKPILEKYLDERFVICDLEKK